MVHPSSQPFSIPVHAKMSSPPKRPLPASPESIKHTSGSHPPKRKTKPSDSTMTDKDPNDVRNTSPYMPMFEHFRMELDEHHDRRERVIKASRDVTAASKKACVQLHPQSQWQIVL